MEHAAEQPASTEGRDYAERLLRLEQAWWKRALDVQRPYRRNLLRLVEGRVLDVGCGIGRNLATLGDRAVGVDHNADSVAVARARGCTAWTPEEFASRGGNEHFDTLLLAHVVEHMTRADAQELLRQYLPHLRPGGRLVLICPQEKGFASDSTHVEFVDLDAMADLCNGVGAHVEHRASFPFPRVAGRWFPYNEFVVAARVPS